MILGLSGGADSTALLSALAAFDFDISTVAVHCNFHLRGAESDRDRDYCTQICDELGIDLRILDFDVQSYMRDHSVSMEMACRELRYGEFRRLLVETHADRIAVAHNAEDNAETVLLNLMRGSGVSGLRGMLPDTGEIIRPLLSITRKEILSYLDERGIDYVTDSTNLSSDFRRNFIRNEVIPLLETRWPDASRSIRHTASVMRQEERVLQWTENQFIQNGETVLAYSEIDRCPEPLWLIYRFISRFGGTSSQSVEILRSLQSEAFQTGKRWHVAKGRICLERDGLEFIEDTFIRDLQRGIKVEVKEFAATESLLEDIRHSSHDTLWTSLPPDKVIFRHPATGDRICPLGLSGSSRVAKVLKDAHMSQAEKESTVVAVEADSGETLWIAGLKRSSLFLADKEHKTLYRYRVSSTPNQK